MNLFQFFPRIFKSDLSLYLPSFLQMMETVNSARLILPFIFDGVERLLNSAELSLKGGCWLVSSPAAWLVCISCHARDRKDR
jgi:hypothetical protein